MSSIHQRALGADFDRLHPEIAARFGFSSADGHGSVGTGVMDEVWRAPGFTRPFLAFGTWRNILFPKTGYDIPFTIENFPYVDGRGRETVTFELGHTRRRSDATMVFSEQRRCILDYLGTHHHLAADVHLAVDDRGGLHLRTSEQRFHEHAVSFRFPASLTGAGDVHESFDEGTGRHNIEVVVSNPRFGRLFGCRGSFTVERREIPVSGVAPSLKPVREERRE